MDGAVFLLGSIITGCCLKERLATWKKQEKKRQEEMSALEKQIREEDKKRKKQERIELAEAGAEIGIEVVSRTRFGQQPGADGPFARLEKLRKQGPGCCERAGMECVVKSCVNCCGCECCNFCGDDGCCPNR